jgi:hypothetical protein
VVTAVGFQRFFAAATFFGFLAVFFFGLAIFATPF